MEMLLQPPLFLQPSSTFPLPVAIPHQVLWVTRHVHLVRPLPCEGALLAAVPEVGVPVPEARVTITLLESSLCGHALMIRPHLHGCHALINGRSFGLIWDEPKVYTYT